MIANALNASARRRGTAFVAARMAAPIRPLSLHSEGKKNRRMIDAKSTTPSPNEGPESSFDHLPPLESANPDRIKGILVNPAGIGSTVLPGGLVYKHFKWSGNTRKVPLELVHGYFWMMWDSRKCDGKPTLSNQSLIPEDEAQLFPVLEGLHTLSGEKADLPIFFLDKQQGTIDALPHCATFANDLASYTLPEKNKTGETVRWFRCRSETADSSIFQVGPARS